LPSRLLRASASRDLTVTPDRLLLGDLEDDVSTEADSHSRRSLEGDEETYDNNPVCEDAFSVSTHVDLSALNIDEKVALAQQDSVTASTSLGTTGIEVAGVIISVSVRSPSAGKGAGRC